MSGKPRPGSTNGHRNSVAAGAAALAAQAELEPLENAKLEAEIPDELKEDPTPESLFAMDKRMTEVRKVLLIVQLDHCQHSSKKLLKLHVLFVASIRYQHSSRIARKRLSEYHWQAR